MLGSILGAFPSFLCNDGSWTGLSASPRDQGNAAYTGPCFCLPQFALQEEKRQKAERLHQQQKHESQMKDMQAQCESNANELQHLQVLIPHGLASQSCLCRSQPLEKRLQRAVTELVSPCSCLERLLLPCLNVELRALNVSGQDKSCLTTGCAVPAA